MQVSDTFSPSRPCAFCTLLARTTCRVLHSNTRTAFDSLCFQSSLAHIALTCFSCCLFQCMCVFFPLVYRYTLLHCTAKRVLVPVFFEFFVTIVHFQSLLLEPKPSHKCKLQYLERSRVCVWYISSSFASAVYALVLRFTVPHFSSISTLELFDPTIYHVLIPNGKGRANHIIPQAHSTLRL